MKFLLPILSLAFVFSACKKYEEGPHFSLLTKKMRVVGEWKAEQVISKSGDVVFVQVSPEWRIRKDNTFEILEDNSVAISGTWDFSQDKDYLRFTYKEEGISNVLEYEIIRLRYNELWMKDIQGIQTNYVPS